MTNQEVLWQNRKVLIVSIMSKSGALHMKHKRYVGRTGMVEKESKNGMLLIRFNYTNRSPKYISIPASCLIHWNGDLPRIF